MSFASFLIVAFIFILTGLFIMRPFLVQSESKGRSSSSLYDSLIAERERLLSAIEELELELDLKKISEKEYIRNRDILLVEAAEVLKKLDKYQKKHKIKNVKISTQTEEDDLERLIAERRKQLKTQSFRTCTNCEKEVGDNDQFCSHCGEAL
jgi:hypothetical protein